ncbi:MAG: Rid family detoxifying hydrolase [candidate division WOR-3 bacterium]
MLPKAIGPYSLLRQVSGRDVIFLSGQLGINPETGELEDGLEKQTIRALENIKAILGSVNLSIDNVVKTTIYLVNPEDFSTVNEVYGKYFKEPYPARTTIFVKALPKNALIEIDAIAVL